MEQHPRALTSHTNLEMIKMALAVFAAERCLQRAAHRRHLEFSLPGWKGSTGLPGALALPGQHAEPAEKQSREQKRHWAVLGEYF